MTEIYLPELGKILEVGSNVAVPLNIGIADIRDVQARTGTFSKSIKLVGTKNNNEVFSQLFDVNAVQLTYNVNRKVVCILVSDGVTTLDNATIQLVDVERISDSLNDHQQLSYTVLIKDSVGELFARIGNRELTHLDFSEVAPVISASAIVASFGNTYLDKFKFVMPMSSDNTYLFSEYNPAIYVRNYFDKIFANAGFTYEMPTFLNKWIIPYNGGVAVFSETVNSNIRVVATDTLISSSGGLTPLIVDTEVQDPATLYNPVTGAYTCPYSVITPNSFNVELELNLDFRITNAGATYTTTAPLSTSYHIRSSNFNSILVFNTILPVGTVVPNGTTTFGSFVGIKNLLITNVLAGQVLTFHIFRPETLGGVASNLGHIRINTIKMSIDVSQTSVISGQTVALNGYIPKKIKQSDFVKSIFQMANLFCSPSKDNPRHIVIKTRDEFYDSGKVVDWSQKKKKASTLTFLPEVTAKELTLSYKDDSDDLNKAYKDTITETYGEVTLVFDNEFIKNKERKELIFGASPFVQTTFGAMVTGLNGTEPKSLLRVVLDGGIETCSPYSIMDTFTVGQINLTTYPLTIHFDSALNPTDDINFGICDYYFAQFGAVTNNNLTTKYWSRTMSQINNGKMLTGMFDLTPVDIYKFELNDKIFVDNAYWHVNKIIDYDGNNNELTRVELISADDLLRLPVIIKPIKPAPNGGLIGKPIKAILKSVNESLNITQATGDILIIGKHNVVNSTFTKGIVEGNYKNVVEDVDSGYVVSGYVNNGYVDGEVATTKITFVTSTNKTVESAPNVDYVYFVSGTTTLTMPTAVGNYNRYTVKNISGVTTIDGHGTEHIEDALTASVIAKDSVDLASDNINWYII